MQKQPTRSIWNTCRVLGALVLLLAGASVAHAQREPLYTQYMYNIGSFNPAYVGSVERPDLSLLYRAQWIDIPLSLIHI